MNIMRIFRQIKSSSRDLLVCAASLLLLQISSAPCDCGVLGDCWAPLNLCLNKWPSHLWFVNCLGK